MAVTTGKKSVTQVDFMAHDTSAVNAAVDDVFGGSATLHTIVINNGGTKAYVKFYDAAEPSVGTTEPSIILVADASKVTVWNVVEGIAFTNVSYNANNAAGKTSGDNPGGTLALSMVVR
jgi:hypothetical protein